MKEEIIKEIRDVKACLSTELAVVKTDVGWIKKTLEGNGGTGLLEKVEKNTKWRWKMIGALTVLSGLVTWGLFKP